MTRRSALGASAADLIVSEAELRVVLAPMSSAHRTNAIAALCDELNADAAVFPGSALRLRYSVEAGVWSASSSVDMCVTSRFHGANMEAPPPKAIYFATSWRLPRS